jgi:hypothetical protein
MTFTAEERSKRARHAALVRSSKEPSGAAMTKPARISFRESFYERTDPSLPEDERRRQGEAAYHAYMSDLSKKGVAARRKVDQALVELVDELEDVKTQLELIATYDDAV